jgi:predicted TIM-barrel fold metal-dependent hydrolase
VDQKFEKPQKGKAGKIMLIKRFLVLILFAVFVVQGQAFAFERKDQVKRFDEKIRGMIQKGILPIIDVEYHHGGKIENVRFFESMDKNGVALVWLGPNERFGSEESLRMNEQYPDRFVPTTVHGDGPLWHGTDKTFLEKLAGDARSGKYFAMGEFEARHYPGSHNSRDVHLPVDSFAMETVFQLSSETGLPFLLHHEAEDALLPELDHMLTKYPRSKVIWCHAGRNRNPKTWTKFNKVDGIRDYLKKYPNLYFDLVQSPPRSKYHWTGYVDAIMYNTDRAVFLDIEWQKLFEEFPERFVIGSDVNTGRFQNYDRVFENFRNIVFKALKKDTAERFAFKNAWKLMTGEDWKN